MAARVAIQTADREFFELVARIAFCNPFTDERPALDARIVGHPVELFAEAHLEEMTRIISARVQRLEDAGFADVRKYSAADRGLMQIVFLFEIYHQFYRDFDQLILDQVRLGTQPAPVRFASEVLER